MKIKSTKEGKPSITIIIPVEKETKHIKETLKNYSKQKYKNFEVIISTTDKFTSKYKFVKIIIDENLKGDVSSKRNKILKYGKGEIFVFNDDDVSIPENYLKNIANRFKNKEVLAACGPLLTPKNDSFMQKASGAVWESYLGSLGAGIYRSRVQSARIVYDYPAANLIIRKKVFKKISGFQKGLYPGEDTKLCLDFLNIFKKGINYDPYLFVYHHRKALFKDHLRQIGKYGTQRGWFSLSFPETSLKIQYFLPSILLIYIILVLFLINTNLSIPSLLYVPLYFYLFLLAIEGLILMYRKGVSLGILALLGIILTHLYYGYKFIKSFTIKLVDKLLRLSKK